MGKKKDFPAVELTLKKSLFLKCACWDASKWNEQQVLLVLSVLQGKISSSIDIWTAESGSRHGRFIHRCRITHISLAPPKSSNPLKIQQELRKYEWSSICEVRRKRHPLLLLCHPSFSEFITAVDVFQAANGRLGWGCSFGPAEFAGLWLRLLSVLRESHNCPCPSPLWVNTYSRQPQDTCDLR